LPGEDHASLILRTVDSAAFTTDAAVLAAPSAAVAVASAPIRTSQHTAHKTHRERKANTIDDGCRHCEFEKRMDELYQTSLGTAELTA